MSDVSVILNVYKRPHTLEQQIDSILNQSIKINPEDIHVWYNYSGIQQNLPKNSKINTYISNTNTKFWGRFTIPLYLKTKYIALFDDDTIPQKDWLKNCIETIEKPETNGILGGSGVIIKTKGYKPYQKVGWNGIHSNKTERVDLVGHAWFFRQEWAKYIWYEKPSTWDTGEDIMFSYLAQKYGGINTFVPPHPENNKNLWSTDFSFSAKVGNDSNASALNNANLQLQKRGDVCIDCINNGWKTVNNIK